VIAALTLPYSNGPTEGVNTKTKRIARQMHGRASFTLLRHRFLLGLRHNPSPPNVRQGRIQTEPETVRSQPASWRAVTNASLIERGDIRPTRSVTHKAGCRSGERRGQISCKRFQAG
jgi:hypothetical protein